MMRGKQAVIWTVVLLVAAFCTGSGCAMFPGGVSESVSGFDGSMHWSMRLGGMQGNSTALFAPNEVAMGLGKNTKMPKEQYILTAAAFGQRSFAVGKSLQVNVDGQIFSFESMDKVTSVSFIPGSYTKMGGYLPGWHQSTKRYVVDRAFLDRLLAAKKAHVRLDLGKTFAEGRFAASDVFTGAKRGFRNLLKRVDAYYAAQGGAR